MATKEITMIIKIMGIIGVIFCLIALLTPWGGSSFTFGIISEGYSTPFHIDLFTNQQFHNFLGAGQVIFFAIAMIIIFILTLVALILGFNNIRNIGIKQTRFLMLGIILLVDIILYVIAVSVLSSGYTTFGAYGIGFVMALIAAIMFFIVYGIQRTLMPSTSPAMYQQPAYQQPVYQQPPPVQQTPPPQPQAQPQPQQQTQQPAQKPTKVKAITPKFCPECGGPLQPNVKFCPSCGNKL